MSFAKTVIRVLFAGLLLATTAATGFAQQSAPQPKGGDGKVSQSTDSSSAANPSH
jgi:hypothetical protein